MIVAAQHVRELEQAAGQLTPEESGAALRSIAGALERYRTRGADMDAERLLLILTNACRYQLQDRRSLEPEKARRSA